MAAKPGAYEQSAALGGHVGSDGKGRFLAYLFVIVALTFAAAYYIPLYRTHSRLVTEYGALSDRVSKAEQDAARAQAELATASTKNEALAAERKAEDGAKASRSALLSRAEKDVREKIASEGNLSEAHRGDRVAIRIAPSALKTVKDHVEVSSDVTSALCDAMAAVTSSSLGFFVVARVGSGAGKDPWSSAADRATGVAKVLAQKCNVSSDRIAATARLGSDADGSVSVEIGASER